MKHKNKQSRFSYLKGYISVRAVRDIHILVFLVVNFLMWVDTPYDWFSTRDIGINYQIALTVLWFVLVLCHTYVVRLIGEREQLLDELEEQKRTDNSRLITVSRTLQYDEELMPESELEYENTI